MTRSERSWVSLGIITALVTLVGLAGTADAAPKRRSGKTSKTAKTEKAPEGAAEFDRRAAGNAIGEVSLQKCRATNATKGEGHVSITFGPSGAAQSATVDRGPWVGTPVGKCMARAFKTAKVPAFRGEAITVGKSFHFD